jgi:hypothetical protein
MSIKVLITRLCYFFNTISKEVIGIGDHKMYIFTANIPTFHIRYRR